MYIFMRVSMRLLVSMRVYVCVYVLYLSLCVCMYMYVCCISVYMCMLDACAHTQIVMCVNI